MEDGGKGPEQPCTPQGQQRRTISIVAEVRASCTCACGGRWEVEEGGRWRRRARKKTPACPTRTRTHTARAHILTCVRLRVWRSQLQSQSVLHASVGELEAACACTQRCKLLPRSTPDHRSRPQRAHTKHKTHPMQADDCPVCWICLDGPAPERPLVHPCRCPSWCHAACIARWQLQSAGTR